MEKLLFPISLGNNTFSTERVLSSLNGIPDKYEEIVFIIADQIQLYNKSIVVKDGYSLDETIKKFYSGRTLFDQRRTWLDRVKKELGATNKFLQWKIFGFDDIADQMFSRIYRNVLIMYHTIIEFQNDIISEAQNYLLKRISETTTENSIKLSTSYILEEIAASIRLHVCEDIADEYYLGNHLNCILKLYMSKYGISVFSLAGVYPRPIDWHFFEIESISEPYRWIEKR